MLCVQPNNTKVINSVKTATGYGTDRVKKRCSIVLFIGTDCPNAYNYVHSLLATSLPGLYELIIINNSSVAIDESHIKTIIDDIKIIKPPAGLDFVQLCLLAAQEAKGEYTIFSQCQLDENLLDNVIERLENLKVKIVIPVEKNFILVNRAAFLDKGSFDRLAHKQESTKQEKEQKSYHQNLLNDMRKYVDIRNQTVLDVGCNRGLECDLLACMGAKEVTGLDIIEDVGQGYPHPRIRYVRGSAEKIPFKDNSFDICCSMATLEHVLNPKDALEEMVRVTAKRGIIYCFAAPLWNSAFGHHKETIFPNDPWIHLRKKNAEGMKSYYKDRCKEIIQSAPIGSHIDYIYSDGYNQISTREYKSIVADLFQIVSPVHIRFGMNFKHLELLTPDILSELQDYSEEELLTSSLRLVMRKV